MRQGWGLEPCTLTLSAEPAGNYVRAKAFLYTAVVNPTRSEGVEFRDLVPVEL